MTELVTIFLSYYNQPKSIILTHINHWKQFKRKELFKFCIVDDGSSIPINDHLNDVDLKCLNLVRF